MHNNLLPAVIPKYRIKEYNPAYDSIFGKGKGWILCTNFIYNIFKAHMLSVAFEKIKGLKHEVICVAS